MYSFNYSHIFKTKVVKEMMKMVKKTIVSMIQ